jgi:hypothetical protein
MELVESFARGLQLLLHRSRAARHRGWIAVRGKVKITSVDIGWIFLIAAGCFLAYIPALMIEKSLFFGLAWLSIKYRYLRHLEFLLQSLKLKLNIIIDRAGALLYINLGTNLFDYDTATLAMNVFITSVAIWAVFTSSCSR